MSDNTDFDLEALVKTAASFPPEQLAKFLVLVPTTTRESVVKRLNEIRDVHEASGMPTISLGGVNRDAQAQNSIEGPEFEEDELSVKLPPTIIVNQGEVENAEPPEFVRKTGLTLIKLHARGAVGEIFIAYDQQLSRELAIKRIRPELPFSDQRVRRFIREAEITAKLQHPGIVPIYSLNESGAESHYTMPLVSGSTLSNLIFETHRGIGPRPSREEWKSKLRPLLTHFIAVCHAIGYAHSEQVLHRDIKPANIIIGTQGQTLVLDWGCAKKIGEEDTIGETGRDPEIGDDEINEIYGMDPGASGAMTVAGSVMGTVQFMSPEQASGDGKLVGIHSDIFGLGATLFNVICGDVAFDFKGTDPESVDKALEKVKRGEFRRVEEFDSRVPPALAAICNRAMATDPADRYRTADDLARDVDAFLAGEPVFAYQEPLTDRTLRFVKRHRTLFTTLFGALLVGFVSLAFATLTVNQQRGILSQKNDELASMNTRLERSISAESQLKTAAVVREKAGMQQLYETQMLLASEASSEPGGVGRMRQLVNRWSDPEFETFRGWEWKHLDALGHRELWQSKLNVTANQILFTRDSSNAVVVDSTRGVIVKIDADQQRVMDRVKLPVNVTSIDFNNDQSLMALGFRNGIVKVFRTRDKDAEPVEFKKLESAVIDVQWNIGGDLLATCDASGEMAVWQWFDRKVVGTGKGVLNQADKRLLNWSYDGKQVCWTTGTEVRGLTIATKKEEVIVRDDWIVNPCWSHEGKLFGYIGPENTIIVTDMKTKKTSRFTGHQLFVESLAWHPRKNYLLSASADGTVRVWNADTEKQVQQLLGHTGHVYSAVWNRNGDKVVSGGLPEDSLNVWDVSNLGSEAFERELQDHPAMAWHPTGTQLVVAENADIIIQNDLGESRWIRSSDPNSPEIYGIDLDVSGEQIACVSRKGKIWTVDASSGEIVKVYDEGSDANMFPDITSKGVAWSSDGKYLAGVGGGGKVRVWDASTGEDISQNLPKHEKGLVVAWSPQERKQVATGFCRQGRQDYYLRCERARSSQQNHAAWLEDRISLVS